MIDQQQFEKLRKEMVEEDEQREQLIAKSRAVVRASKLLIYALHRSDSTGAAAARKEMDTFVAELRKITKGSAALDASGSTRIAMQEFVEAACFQAFAEGKPLPSAEQLQVDAEQYLLGLCDLSGEVGRKAVHAAIAMDLPTVKRIRDFVEALYGEMLKFDFRNGELRRKFDGIKYDLKKLEDLVLDLSLKER